MIIPISRFIALAFCVAMSPLLSRNPAFAGDTFRLDSVDFNSSGDHTRIVLHTGSMVPVQRVLVSDTKLVLDIDQVNADETVRTNFSGTNNVSHVILQPLNDHQIRMIVRGEHLNAPSIAFFGAGGVYSEANPEFGGERIEKEARTALDRIQEKGVRPAELQAPISGNPALDARSFPAETPIVFHDEMPDAKSAKPVVNAGSAAPAQSAVNPTPPAVETATTKTPEMQPIALPDNTPAPSSGDLLENLSEGGYQRYLPYGILGLLLLGLGGFIYHKLGRLRQQESASMEDLSEMPTGGERSRFREMADAYREQRETRQTEESMGLPRGKKASPERMIGLNGLNRLEEEAGESAANSQANARPASTAASLERMITAIQAASAAPKQPIAPAPKKQAVNRYLQQEKPAAAPAMESDEERIREMLRARTARQEVASRPATPSAVAPKAGVKAGGAPKPQAPINQAALGKKGIQAATFQSVPPESAIRHKSTKSRPPIHPAAPSGQGPLPGNPEVLNFLRNVAELMEKDGKPEIAKSIHRNLKTQP